MSLVVRLLLGVSLLLLGNALAAVGPQPLLVAAVCLTLACLAFPDRAWRLA